MCVATAITENDPGIWEGTGQEQTQRSWREEMKERNDAVIF